jgi:hypothetical protein
VLLLDPNDPVRTKLSRLTLPIATIARDCIQTIFHHSCQVNPDWEVVERLRGDFRHNICLGCGSGEYQAIAVLGAGDREIDAFIGSLAGSDILDAFGEMLNVYFGMLMDDIEFTDAFGILTQSIPQYSAEINFYPRAWSCHGTLAAPSGGDLYLGFAIKSIR